LGVDPGVRRIETAYDTGGRPYLFTSFDAPSGGNIVNQVQECYNGLRKLGRVGGGVAPTASHRSVRAQLTHTARQITDSLRLVTGPRAATAEAHAAAAR
jgi:hypothetical protein